MNKILHFLWPNHLLSWHPFYTSFACMINLEVIIKPNRAMLKNLPKNHLWYFCLRYIARQVEYLSKIHFLQFWIEISKYISPAVVNNSKSTWLDSILFLIVSLYIALWIHVDFSGLIKAVRLIIFMVGHHCIIFD